MTNTPKSNLARTNKTFLKQNSFLADFGFFFHGKARTNPLGVSLDWSIRSVAYLINEIWRLHIRAKELLGCVEICPFYHALDRHDFDRAR